MLCMLQCEVKTRLEMVCGLFLCDILTEVHVYVCTSIGTDYLHIHVCTFLNNAPTVHCEVQTVHTRDDQLLDKLFWLFL